MAKVNIVPVSNLANQTSAANVINTNFQNLKAVVETLVSRDGAQPNHMQAPLDMNARRIINLPPPQSGTDAARLQDVLGAEFTLPDNLVFSEAIAELQVMTESAYDALPVKQPNVLYILLEG